MYKQVIFFLCMHAFLFGDNQVSITRYDCAENVELPECEWFNWFSSKPENTVFPLIKELRNSSYHYYYDSNLGDLNQVAITTKRIRKVSLDAGIEVQISISSLYNGSDYYEGFSQACAASDSKTLKDEVWTNMDQQARDMAITSFLLTVN